MTTTMTTTELPVSRSRLEINLIRLLEETQQMANGNKTKDWKYEKVRECFLGITEEKANTLRIKVIL